MPAPGPARTCATAALWLGIDLGTQGVRAQLVDGDGTVHGSGNAPLLRGRRDGPRHEQDPREWWEATGAAVRSALADHAGHPLGAVCVDGTSGTLVLQDRGARPVGPGLMYDDARAASVPLPARTEAALDDLAARLGHPVPPTWALHKLLLLAAEDRLGPDARPAHQGDHITGRLVGRPVPTDPTQALKSGHDPEHGWPTALLDRLGLDPAHLPEVVPTGTPVGTVGAEAARHTGIPAGTPVRAGTTDGVAAQIASAALAPGRWAATLGTTLVLKGSTPHRIHDPAGAVYSHRNPDGGWLPGGAANAGTRVWAHDLPGHHPADLTERVRGLPVPGGATYPLTGTGERFPFVAPDAAGFDTGPGSGTTDPAERFHRLAHGLAHVERLALERLQHLGAPAHGPVTATGGAADNTWLTQLRADVLRRPVLVPAHTGSAFGSAVLARAPQGALADTAEAMVRTARRHDPDPDRADALDEAHERFLHALAERGWLAPTPQAGRP
ncbi:carbohydrate kinase [Nocardiopsis sp. HNM0947]|uniref:Carbohydrate kinase n=1 Tax=Nocardiopsis coralli TaxID=2772213 RepID=A0ABR9P811_9ACTN|nr:FGGY family carbohydrate kinase [Nocardiopsis coralli]MBE2999957.1 carbohydrate kinase [Nocardiopsis coralli]